jgi:hypothetical protein
MTLIICFLFLLWYLGVYFVRAKYDVCFPVCMLSWLLLPFAARRC